MVRTFLRMAALAVAGPAIAEGAPIGEHFAINGMQMYAEVAGDGDPVIVLHGGIAAIDVMSDTIARLSEGHKVIAPHLQGHGFTDDIDRPLSYEAMADDIAVLMEKLDLRRADVVGYSLGGGVAIQFAIRHPDLVDRLVVVSAAMRRDGAFPEILLTFDQMARNAPTLSEQLVRHTSFDEMYPDVDWTRLFKKSGEMLSQDFSWWAEVARIEAPTMLVYADADSTRPEHMVAFWKLIGGGQRDAGLDGMLRPENRLAIIPGSTHYDILSGTAVAEAIIPFLDEGSQ